MVQRYNLETKGRSVWMFPPIFIENKLIDIDAILWLVFKPFTLERERERGREKAEPNKQWNWNRGADK
jgi:hypothetical protein